MRTVWILGDQLDRHAAGLDGATPDETRILMVRSRAKLGGGGWHRQRLHLVLTAMERFAAELRAEGFDVDLRDAPTLAEGCRAHCRSRRPTALRVMEPMSWDGIQLLRRGLDLGAGGDGSGVELEVVPSNQFLCHADEFAAWAGDRPRLVMEDFYRWQRRRLGYLMDGDQPAGGRWNFDADNREPPPRDGRSWPAPVVDDLDDLDREVMARVDAVPGVVGDEPWGLWATDRSGAQRRLDHFVREVLPIFGPHEDAMLSSEWKLAHSTLSPYLNLGLLHPAEVCDAVEVAYRDGLVPIASAEGFLRQVIGWREFVWGVYRLWMPSYRGENALGARRPLPPVLTGGRTDMACVASALDGVRSRGWTHHIERLMVLGNLCLLAGVEPGQVVRWMWRSFVDGAEWVMLPNVVGMALHADGGRMATKPYAGGGAYVNRMSDHCRGCRYDPRARTGDVACPFTTLYWDFLARNEGRLSSNHRLAQPYAGMRRLSDLPDVRRRAAEVLRGLDAGTL